MKVEETKLPGVLVITPKRFGDERGYFAETFEQRRYFELGIPTLVQMNHSHSAKGTLRGLHFQEPKPQGKLVWIVGGAVLDVVLDVRRSSPSFGEAISVELSSDNGRQIWVPPGYAHGFCVLSDRADCFYGCTDFYAPDCERAIAWNDPDLSIPWPEGDFIVSGKDAVAPRLADAPVLPA